MPSGHYRPRLPVADKDTRNEAENKDNHEITGRNNIHLILNHILIYEKLTGPAWQVKLFLAFDSVGH
jgi:hypothetical protein